MRSHSCNNWVALDGGALVVVWCRRYAETTHDRLRLFVPGTKVCQQFGACRGLLVGFSGCKEAQTKTINKNDNYYYREEEEE